ncbi:MAG: HlyD family efflux transporter periplasmic adaptor subunit [Deltaproteobacteria bacterium]|nr:HlyD family efflux transporter periplasmic adaptor subunit [Deltaproteobacteria bacterium]
MNLLLLLATLLACSGRGGGPPVYTGTVEITEVDVAPLVPGRLVEVKAREGDTVRVGDTLFGIDTRTTLVEREARAAQVEQAQAAVETGRAQVRAAEAQMAVLDREAGRTRALLASGAGTDQQVSQIQGQFEVAKAQASAARQVVQQAEAAVAGAEAALSLVDEKIRESTVLAPVDGVVLSRNREPGEVLGAGTSVITLGDLAHPRLRLYVPLGTLESIAVGTLVEVRLDAEGLPTARGRVSWIAQEAEFTPRDILTPEERVKQVFAVDVALEPGPGIHPGIPADAVFLAGETTPP